jgi:hypothetical protein
MFTNGVDAPHNALNGRVPTSDISDKELLAMEQEVYEDANLDKEINAIGNDIGIKSLQNTMGLGFTGIKFNCGEPAIRAASDATVGPDISTKVCDLEKGEEEIHGDKFKDISCDEMRKQTCRLIIAPALDQMLIQKRIEMAEVGRVSSP